MVATKIYVTWNAFLVKSLGGVHALHPEQAISTLWPDMTFTALAYGNTSTDKRMLGILEYDTDNFSEDALARFWKNFGYFTLTEITVSKALELCNEWYPNEPAYFSLAEDEFTLIDGRPTPEGFP
jgi:hypothetical protein